MNKELCPMCMNVSFTVHTDENERSFGFCDEPECGYRKPAADYHDDETPLGHEIDGGNDHVDDDLRDYGWPGDGSGEDDLADYNANEADDYHDE